MNYLKHPRGASQPIHDGYERAKPLTPLSDRARASYGSLEMSIQNVPGLCGKERPGKGACWRKADHEGDCP